LLSFLNALVVCHLSWSNAPWETHVLLGLELSLHFPKTKFHHLHELNFSQATFFIKSLGRLQKMVQTKEIFLWLTALELWFLLDSLIMLKSTSTIKMKILLLESQKYQGLWHSYRPVQQTSQKLLEAKAKLMTNSAQTWHKLEVAV